TEGLWDWTQLTRLAAWFSARTRATREGSTMTRSGRRGDRPKVLLSGAVVLLTLGATLTSAPAQQAQHTPPLGPAGAEAQSAASPPAWVKLCEKSGQGSEPQTCFVSLERIDADSGRLIVYAAVLTSGKPQLMVELPDTLPLNIPAGLEASVDDGK